MSSLITHELAMQHRTNDDQKKKKTIVFKVSLEMNKLEEESENDYSSVDDIEDDDIAMVVRIFKKFMEKKRKDTSKNFPKKESTIRTRTKKRIKKRIKCPYFLSVRDPSISDQIILCTRKH